MICASKINLYENVNISELKASCSKQSSPYKQDLIDYMNCSDFCSSYTTLKVFDYIKNTEVDIPIVGYKDSTYYWDDRDIYYLQKYNIEPNDDFIQHVLNQ